MIPEKLDIEIFLADNSLGNKISYRKVYKYFSHRFPGLGDYHLLCGISKIFTVNHPEDYSYRSLSFGDMIGINGKYYRRDPLGWTKLDGEEFLKW